MNKSTTMQYRIITQNVKAFFDANVGILYLIGIFKLILSNANTGMNAMCVANISLILSFISINAQVKNFNVKVVGNTYF
jgi:hypothetical protein